MNWINIIDTAVKIGLGAAIAGVFGYILAKQNHMRDAEKAYTEKRREFLAEVVDNLNEFHKTFLKFRGRYQDHIIRRDAQKGDTPEQIDELRRCEDSFTHGFEQLTDAQGYVLAIGEVELYNAFISYTNTISDANDQLYVGNSSITENDIVQINTKVRKAREDTLLKVAVAFKKAT